MRWYFKAMILAAMGFVGVELAAAQQPPFGGFGKAPSNPATLLQNESVKKELRLTDEQLAKIPDAVMKALAQVLDDDQLKRLKQIELQLKGARAFVDPKVQASLKMNDEQKENIKAILADADKEMVELAKELKGGNFQGIAEKMTAINKETKERCASVLTTDQKRMWQEMIGDEFKMERPILGKKKNDA